MRSPSFRHSTEVQTVLFDVSAFTPATAAAWARSHGFRAPAGDVTDRYIRLRQREPAAYRAGTFRTITLTDGVLAVVGVPKAGGNLKPRKNAGRGTGHGRTAYLLDYSTGRIVREATPAEHKASQKQIERDGIGIIVIDGREYITETDVVHNPARHNGRTASGSTRPTRTAQVSAYLAAHGFPGVTLHKGPGYLYFSGGGSETWPETSVMTYRVSDQTLDQWLSDVRRLAGGARRNTGAGAHYEEARTAIRRAIAARGAPDYDARYVEAAHALNRAERHREQTAAFLAPRGSVPVPPMATHRPWRRNPAKITVKSSALHRAKPGYAKADKPDWYAVLVNDKPALYFDFNRYRALGNIITHASYWLPGGTHTRTGHVYFDDLKRDMIQTVSNRSIWESSFPGVPWPLENLA